MLAGVLTVDLARVHTGKRLFFTINSEGERFYCVQQ